MNKFLSNDSILQWRRIYISQYIKIIHQILRRNWNDRLNIPTTKSKNNSIIYKYQAKTFNGLEIGQYLQIDEDSEIAIELNTIQRSNRSFDKLGGFKRGQLQISAYKLVKLKEKHYELDIYLYKGWWERERGVLEEVLRERNINNILSQSERGLRIIICKQLRMTEHISLRNL